MSNEATQTEGSAPQPDACAILMDLYKDDCTQARHHEEQRSSVTNIIVAVSAGLIAFIAHGKQLHHAAWMPCSLLIFLGLYGALCSAKHYERAQRHGIRARAYREKVAALCPTANLLEICDKAQKKTEHDFPCLARRKLYHLWIGLNLFISLLGALILFQALK